MTSNSKFGTMPYGPAEWASEKDPDPSRITATVNALSEAIEARDHYHAAWRGAESDARSKTQELHSLQGEIQTVLGQVKQHHGLSLNALLIEAVTKCVIARDAASVQYAVMRDSYEPLAVERNNWKATAEKAEAEAVALKKEVEWLRYYKKNVYQCLGPADDEINRDIRRAFVREFGLDALPTELRAQHLEYEADHAGEH